MNNLTAEHSKTVNKSFLTYFRKRKGVYSQEDVEKIVANELQAQRDEYEKKISQAKCDMSIATRRLRS